MKIKLGWIIALTFSIIIMCYVIGIHEAASIASYFYPEEKGLGAAGLFGDSAGALNALFSALAFGGVILTIYWQISTEIRQRETGYRVQFENVFFNMSSTFEAIVAGLEEHIYDMMSNQYVPDNTDYQNDYQPAKIIGFNTSSTDRIIKGRDVFEYLYLQKKYEGSNLKEHLRNGGLREFEELMDGKLDHYFRYLYRILKYIDSSKLITDDKKYEYVSIFRAQLSKYELLLLFYNGLSLYGRDKLKSLLEKYAMFNNLRTDDLANRSKEIAVNASDPNSDNCKYSDDAFEHENYTNDKFTAKPLHVILSCTAIVCLINLLQNFWCKYIVCDLLQYIPNNNLSILLLLGVIAIWYINSSYKKHRKLSLQYKRLGIDRTLEKVKIDFKYIISAIALGYIYFSTDCIWYGYKSFQYIWIVFIAVFIEMLFPLIIHNEKGFNEAISRTYESLKRFMGIE